MFFVPLPKCIHEAFLVYYVGSDYGMIAFTMAHEQEANGSRIERGFLEAFSNVYILIPEGIKPEEVEKGSLPFYHLKPHLDDKGMRGYSHRLVDIELVRDPNLSWEVFRIARVTEVGLKSNKKKGILRW